MGTILVLITIFLGIIVGIAIVALIVYSKIKSCIPKELQDVATINNVISSGAELAKQVESTPKHASGITNYLIPQITKDFSDFNVNEFYSIVEANLKTVFNILENKDLSLITNDLEPLRENLTQTVKDLKDNDINIRYGDVKFHSHALRK